MKNILTNLNEFKTKADNLDVDKLIPLPVDLSKLSGVLKNDIVKNDVYNAKIKNIDKIPDITNLSSNASLNSKINEVKGEIPRLTNLSINASLNAKINEFKVEIPNITNLATTSALSTVENEIPNVNF